MYLLITYLCDILWLDIWMGQFFSKTSIVFRYVWYSGVSSSDPNLLKSAINICVKFSIFILQSLLTIFLLELFISSAFARVVDLSQEDTIKLCCTTSLHRSEPSSVVADNGQLKHLHNSNYFRQTITHVTCENAGESLSNHHLHFCRTGVCTQKLHRQDVLVQSGHKRVVKESITIFAGCGFRPMQE